MKHVLVVCALILTVACGGGNSPGAGTNPTPVVSPPAITTAADLIYVGQTVQFSATGTGPISWGGDAPSVATVDGPTGRVTGVGIGRVTIWAENAGGRTTRLLRGLPSFAGTWLGDYALIGCSATGDFDLFDFCDLFTDVGEPEIAFDLAQDRDRVTGRFALGALDGTLDAGTISEAGVLPLTGRIADDEGNRINLDGMQAESPSPGTMTGPFDQVWSHVALSGTGRLRCEMRTVTRQSGGPALHLLRPPMRGVKLEDLVRLLRQRR